MATSTPSIQALVSFPSILLMIFFYIFPVHLVQRQHVYPLLDSITPFLPGVKGSVGLLMYLSSLLTCQGWYCVNSYCVFSSPFPPVCVFRYSLPFTRHLCSCKHCLQHAHTLPFTQHSRLCRRSPFHLAFAFVQTLSTVCTHTPFHLALVLVLSLGICALANAVYRVHTLFLSLGTHTRVNTVYKLYVLCEKPGLEPEPSLSPPALRAPARPMV